MSNQIWMSRSSSSDSGWHAAGIRHVTHLIPVEMLMQGLLHVKRQHVKYLLLSL